MRIPWKHTVVTGAALALVAPLGLAAVAHAADATNLALGKPITASSVTQNYVAGNANDGNTGSYWEGAGGGSVTTTRSTSASAPRPTVRWAGYCPPAPSQ